MTVRSTIFPSLPDPAPVDVVEWRPMPAQALASLRGMATDEYFGRFDEAHRRQQAELDDSHVSAQDLNHKTVARGPIRKSPGMKGGGAAQRSRGAVAWYVPDGADWDLTEERSTRLIVIGGESPWHHRENLDGLDSYFRRADQLHYEELEDYDQAPLRWHPRCHPSELDDLLFRVGGYREDDEAS